MARVREEALELPTRAAMLKGLAVTGGVITSAGHRLGRHVLGPRGAAARRADADRHHGCLRRPARHFPRPIDPRPGADVRPGRAHVVAVGPRAPAAGDRRSVARHGSRRTRRRRARGVTGSLLALLALGAVLVSAAMTCLWLIQVRTRDASHVDVGWATDRRPRSGLRVAGGRQRRTPHPRGRARDHLGLAPRPLPPSRPRARQGGGRPLPGPACQVGLAGPPELLPLLPGPGAVRRLLLVAVPADLPRSAPRTRAARVDGDSGLGNRQRRRDHRRPAAGPVAVEPREPRPHGTDGPLGLVEAPELLLRVGYVVRRRARRDRGAVGVGVVDRPGRPPLPALPRDRDPRHRGAGASQPCGLRRLPADNERFVPRPPRADDAHDDSPDRRVTA